jgi:hypothetical protein
VTQVTVLSISEAWLAGAFLVATTGLFVLARFVGRARKLASIRVGEEGVSYSLAFVLTLPFIMLFCCIVVECVMITAAKLGVHYAAYAGARAAIVWKSAKPANVRDERIEQAVLTALAPFTFDRNTGGLPSPSTFLDSTIMSQAYGRLTSGADASRTAPVASVARRYQFAGAKTTITSADGPLTTVKVVYRYRCLLGVAGRILDPDHSSPFEIVITSEAALPTETPPLGDLGIDYHSE